MSIRQRVEALERLLTGGNQCPTCGLPHNDAEREKVLEGPPARIKVSYRNQSEPKPEPPLCDLCGLATVLLIDVRRVEKSPTLG